MICSPSHCVPDCPREGALLREHLSAHCNVPMHKCTMHSLPAAVGECACPVHAADKCIRHAGCIVAGTGRAFSRVCLFVRALKGKRLELSTPNFVHVYSIAVARHALTQRSKGQRSRSHGDENRHVCTVASDACCYGRVLLLPAWVCMSI